MKAKEINKVLESIKRYKTEKLESIIQSIETWEENHDMKKASWFWSPPGKASRRRSREDWNTWEDEIKLGDLVIRYWSNCSISCRHYYWTDGLEHNGSGDMSLTFGDLHKIVAGIQTILERRKMKRSEAAGNGEEFINRKKGGE